MALEKGSNVCDIQAEFLDVALIRSKKTNTCQINNVGEFLKDSKLLGLPFALIFQRINI